jgi:cold shock CspA family protein
MQIPVQIIFDGMGPSEALADKIRRRVAHLEQLYADLISCRVVVEQPHHHHHQGGLFQVRVELGVPGQAPIVGGREGPNDHAHEDAHVAVRDAFDAVERQLRTFVERQHRRTKAHEVASHGTILRVRPDGEFGFLRSSDGLDVYFHRNAVLGGSIDALAPGEAVRFVLHAEEGEHGPQASSVERIGAHHHLPDVETARS